MALPTIPSTVRPNTWYRINLAYNGVKQLSAITSEGLTVEELDTRYPGVLRVGASGPEVTAVQYYLAYISLFYNGVTSPLVDGDFGAGTEEAVKSYQRTFGLTESGEIDLLTWDSIENTYYGILENIPYEFESGIILPFPGRVLRMGVDGNDVRAMLDSIKCLKNGEKICIFPEGKSLANNSSLFIDLSFSPNPIIPPSILSAISEVVIIIIEFLKLILLPDESVRYP